VRKGQRWVSLSWLRPVSLFVPACVCSLACLCHRRVLLSAADSQFGRNPRPPTRKKGHGRAAARTAGKGESGAKQTKQERVRAVLPGAAVVGHAAAIAEVRLANCVEIA
jgi:hypothetical protein